MLSRVADSVFWMARYMERSNGMLRLLRTNYISSQDEVKNFSWQPLLQNYSDASPGFITSIGDHSPRALEHLLLDRDNGSSVINNITRARENGRAVQDHITKEVWQCLNDYYHLMRDPHVQRQVRVGDPVTAMDLLVRNGMFYYGTVDVTMSRGEGFNYLNLGKFLERAILSVDMLHIKLTELDYNLQQRVDVPALRYLLYSLAGYEQYLKTHRGNFQAELVIQQILYNSTFPHSVSYCLGQLSRYFERLEPDSLPESYRHLEFLVGKTLTTVRYSDIKTGDGAGLRQFLQQVRQQLLDIAAALNQYYFGNS